MPTNITVPKPHLRATILQEVRKSGLLTVAVEPVGFGENEDRDALLQRLGHGAMKANARPPKEKLHRELGVLVDSIAITTDVAQALGAPPEKARLIWSFKLTPAGWAALDKGNLNLTAIATQDVPFSMVESDLPLAEQKPRPVAVTKARQGPSLDFDAALRARSALAPRQRVQKGILPAPELPAPARPAPGELAAHARKLAAADRQRRAAQGMRQGPTPAEIAPVPGDAPLTRAARLLRAQDDARTEAQAGRRRLA
ncbi:hypothetical protein [Roseomonas sp. WA12]